MPKKETTLQEISDIQDQIADLSRSGSIMYYVAGNWINYYQIKNKGHIDYLRKEMSKIGKDHYQANVIKKQLVFQFDKNGQPILKDGMTAEMVEKAKKKLLSQKVTLNLL